MARWSIHEKITEEQKATLLIAGLQRIGKQFDDKVFYNKSIAYEWRMGAVNSSWMQGLMLTPWMLMEVFLPRCRPAIQLPENWSEQICKARSFIMMGPGIKVDVGEERRVLHLQWVETIGHFLMLPLVQNLKRFENAHQVWQAWDQVLESRSEATQIRLSALQHTTNSASDQKAQFALSRREFLSGRRMEQSRKSD